MNETQNQNSTYQETFIKLILASIFYGVLAWIFNYWLILPIAKAFSFIVIALISYFYFPAINKLGFWKWAVMVLLITAFFVAMYFGNMKSGKSHIWAGLTLAILGVMSFATNWIYLWIMSNGKKVDSEEDIMTPKTWLIWSGIAGTAMILFGLFIALGLFE